MNGFRRSIVALLVIAGCSGSEKAQEHPVSLPDGSFRVAFVMGAPAADEARLLAMTARLDRTAGRLLLDLSDGSQRSLTVTFRPRSAWWTDCYTMSSHTLDEVADLAPAPLELEGLVFATPLIFAKCSPERMILADEGPGDGDAGVAFDLQ